MRQQHTDSLSLSVCSRELGNDMSAPSCNECWAFLRDVEYSIPDLVATTLIPPEEHYTSRWPERQRHRCTEERAVALQSCRYLPSYTRCTREEHETVLVP